MYSRSSSSSYLECEFSAWHEHNSSWLGTGPAFAPSRGHLQQDVNTAQAAVTSATHLLLHHPLQYPIDYGEEVDQRLASPCRRAAEDIFAIHDQRDRTLLDEGGLIDSKRSYA